MIRVERSEKNIRNGEYYIKAGDIYLVGTAEDRSLLSAFSSLVSEAKSDIYAVIHKDIVYLLNLEKKAVDRLQRSELEIVFMEYPTLIAENLENIKAGRVKVKGFVVKRSYIYLTVFFFLSIVFLSFLKKVKEERERQERLRLEAIRRAQEEAKRRAQKNVVLLECSSNINSFVSNYSFPATVSNGYMIFPGFNTQVSVPIEEEKSQRTGSSVRIVSPTTSLRYQQNQGDLVFTLSNYYDCISFIFSNRSLPLTIRTLQENGCEVMIKGGCLYDEQG